MNLPTISRRDLLKTGTAAASIAIASKAYTQNVKKTPKDLTIGMATTEFRSFTNEQLAKELAAVGIQTIQLFLTQTDSNYWKYNGRNDLSNLTKGKCQEIAGLYQREGISIHSIGVYTNLIHPDPFERKANLSYFEAMMKIGAHMNVKTFITEAGHFYDAEKPAPAIEYHFQEDVWRTMLATAKELDAIAEQYNATVLFEPFYRHFFSTAKRTRVFIDEIGSPRLRVLLDPANLLELNDLGEMFNQLQPYIDCLHAKDRKLHVDHGVPAGQGDLDYSEFVKLAAKHTPDAPLIMEYVGLETYKPALAHLRQIIQNAV
ncbi:MAG: sugar phosphate isomerase/epimerase [Candidatus Omnitrophica bacterium]|nr:sugar phosphate isomerase/epimerase [Candidatus Omnitrophota bacterium]